MSNRIILTCSKGIAPVLKEEVLALGLPVYTEFPAGVESAGTLADCMRLNLHLRTAHRVLWFLGEFPAATVSDYYSGIRKILWEDWIPETEYFSVSSSVEHESIKDTRFANQKCKDAIADRIKEVHGRRPDSGPEQKGASVFVYWRGPSCSVYLDTSGEPLSRRSYRKNPFKAPMQETLAAAVILLSGWRGDGHFINPMCGSGTLAIEAALIAQNRAPGLLRSNFAFMHLRGFRQSEWSALRQQARNAAKKRIDGRIIATDHDPRAIQAARSNAMTAGVDHLMTFDVCDYAQTPVPDGGGIVVLNPEYGERLGEVKRLEAVYSGIGDFLKRKCSGYKGYVFTGNLDLAKKVGLKTSRRITLFNSSIECRLLEYPLYQGSKKKEQ